MMDTIIEIVGGILFGLGLLAAFFLLPYAMAM